MRRTAVAGEQFQALFYSEIEEFADLLFTLFEADGTTEVLTQVPEPSVALPGVQLAAFIAPPAGQYIMVWQSADEHVYRADKLNVSDVMAPTTSPAEVPYVADFDYASGSALTVEAFDTNLVKISGSPFTATEVGDSGHYFSAEVTPLLPGFLLLLWYTDGAYRWFDVLDVSARPSSRSVRMAFSSPLGVGYQGLGVTIGRMVMGEYEVVANITTDETGTISLSLDDGSYYVTVRDDANSDYVFSHNNWTYVVVDPSTRNSGNEVVYTVDYLAVPPYSEVRVPDEKRSTMHVRLLSGPAGTPDRYRKFTVDLLHPWKQGALMVAPGQQSYNLSTSGSADVPLIRGTSIRVTFGKSGTSFVFTVPDQSSFNLAEIPGDNPFAIMDPSQTYPTRTS